MAVISLSPITFIATFLSCANFLVNADSEKDTLLKVTDHSTFDSAKALCAIEMMVDDDSDVSPWQILACVYKRYGIMLEDGQYSIENLVAHLRNLHVPDPEKAIAERKTCSSETINDENKSEEERVQCVFDCLGSILPTEQQVTDHAYPVTETEQPMTARLGDDPDLDT